MPVSSHLRRIFPSHLFFLNMQVKKVDAMYAAALAAVRMRSEGAFDESISSLSSEQASFQNTIKMYFDEDEGSLPSPDLPSVIQPNRSEET